METVRKNLNERFITLAEYRREVVLATIDFLEENHEYELVQEIGRGTYGTVVEIKHPDTQQRLAAKIVLQHSVSKSETDIWPYLSHENLLPLITVEHIVLMHSYIFISPLCYSSLSDIVKGQDLDQDVKGMERALSWFQGICCGVNHLHTEGLCHLDLKLSNVLLSEKDTALICDFGSLTRTNGPTDKLVTHLFSQ